MTLTEHDLARLRAHAEHLPPGHEIRVILDHLEQTEGERSLCDLVARMREAQKEYFRRRLTDPAGATHLLHRCRDLEAQVDRLLAERREGPRQGSLFPGPGRGA
jgi:hypothetical protein